VPLCVFPLVPSSRSFARAYQQSILRTWECEMACPAMPAMLLESRCGRVDCPGFPSRCPRSSSSLLVATVCRPPSPRTPKPSLPLPLPPVRRPFPASWLRVTRSCAVTSDPCTTDAARRIPYGLCTADFPARSVHERSANAARVRPPKVIFASYPAAPSRSRGGNRPFRKWRDRGARSRAPRSVGRRSVPRLTMLNVSSGKARPERRVSRRISLERALSLHQAAGDTFGGPHVDNCV
jgi:hypothetical protein